MENLHLPHKDVSPGERRNIREIESWAEELLGELASSVPPGAITAYAGAVVPDGWLLCDGTAVSRSTYSGLFDAIGTAFGSGNGSTTFNLPNFRTEMNSGVVPMGLNPALTEIDTIGEKYPLFFDAGADAGQPVGRINFLTVNFIIKT